MPRVGITAYDLLLSCPGDVLNTIDIIKEEVTNFNRIFGQLNNIEVIVKHWSTDSFPQAGDKPQELLNKQFIRECDAVVAIFWTRFGTPTDKYQSGTEEEIEEMIKAEKQVFLYFLDKPASPSNIDMEQYEKVKQFKNKYKDKGIYAIVKDEQELKKQFLNHLSLYFLQLFVGNRNTSLAINSPKLEIKSIQKDNTKINVNYRNLLQSKFIKEKEEAIIKLVSRISETSLPEPDRKELQVENTNEINIEGLASLQKQIKAISSSFGTLENVNISKQKDKILAFCKERNIIIKDEFWYVGNLKKHISQMNTYFSNGVSLDGTDEEKEKYKLIQKLYWEIMEYTEYEIYFSKIDKIGLIECFISNNGTTFDEDIDVKVIIHKGCIINTSEMPIPNVDIIGEVNGIQLIKTVFKMKGNESIKQYSDYPINNFIKYPTITNPLGKSVDEEYEDDKKEYLSDVKEVFCYRYYTSDNHDIITFNIQYLKQNVSMYFPSMLIFKQIPEYFEYEIRSKFTSEVVKGKIELHRE